MKNKFIKICLIIGFVTEILFLSCRSGFCNLDNMFTTLSPQIIIKNSVWQKALELNMLIEEKGIYTLGNSMPDKLGKKANGFSEFARLGMSFPRGIAIDGKRLLDDHKKFDERVQVLLKELRNRFSDKAIIAVRASPGISMPEVMDTKLGVKLTDNDLKQAIQAILASYQEKVPSYLKMIYRGKKRPDSIDFGIIFQEMVSADKDDLSGSGVVFSSNVDTGENRIQMSYAVKTLGSEIVSGRVAGKDTVRLKQTLPEIYKKIEQDIKLLEAQTGHPVEVEFSIESGKLYYLQWRPAILSQVAKIKYFQHSGKTFFTDFQEALSLQDGIRERNFGKLKEGVKYKVLAKGQGISSGVVINRFSFDADWVDVMFLNNSNKEKIYGNLRYASAVVSNELGPGSHIAVIARAMGLPMLVNIEGIKSVDMQKKQIIFEDGTVLSEGDQIGVDADKGVLFTVDTNKYDPSELIEYDDSLTLDLTYGVKQSQIREELRKKYASKGYVSSTEKGELIAKNIEAQIAYEAMPPSKEAAEMFMRKHELHLLYLESRQMWRSKDLNEKERLEEDERFTNELNNLIEIARSAKAQNYAVNAVDMEGFFRNIDFLITDKRNYQYRIGRYEDYILGILRRAPYNKKEIAMFAERVINLKEPNTNLGWMNKRVMQEVLKGIYYRLLSQHAVSNKKKVEPLIDLVGKSIGRTKKIIKKDAAFFKKNNDAVARASYFDNNTGFITIKIGDAYGEYMEILEKNLKKFKKNGVILETGEHHSGDNHSGFFSRYYPIIIVPEDMADQVWDVVRDYDKQLGDEGLSSSPSTEISFYNYISSHARKTIADHYIEDFNFDEFFSKLIKLRSENFEHKLEKKTDFNNSNSIRYSI